MPRSLGSVHPSFLSQWMHGQLDTRPSQPSSLRFVFTILELYINLYVCMCIGLQSNLSEWILLKWITRLNGYYSIPIRAKKVSIRFSLPDRFFDSIRQSDKFAACTLIFK